MNPATSLVPSSLPPPADVSINWSTFSPTIRAFMENNRLISEVFQSPESQKARGDWLLSHYFKLSADLCIDGRLSDFSSALGLIMGILEMYRSGGCRGNTFGSEIYKMRMEYAHQKYLRMEIPGGNIVRPMCEIRFVGAHCSGSLPKTHSCAAWSFKTLEALEFVKKHAKRLNRNFHGTMIALPILIDTDTDSITLYGPGGELDTATFGQSQTNLNVDLQTALIDALRVIFPLSWEPLQALKSQKYRDAFYMEIAECLVANVRRYKKIKRTGRKPEELDHQERIMVIGRPSEVGDPPDGTEASPFNRHNGVFLIEDRGSNTNAEDFGTGMKYVTHNVLYDALQTENRDWKVPVVISIPHHPEDYSRMNAQDTAIILRDGDELRYPGLKYLVKPMKGALIEQVMYLLRTSMPNGLPWWAMDSLKHLEDHVEWCVTVNDRRTRRMIPVSE